MGLIDPRWGGDSLCVRYETTVINISEKTVKQKKKFPSLFSASCGSVGLGQVMGKFPFS